MTIGHIFEEVNIFLTFICISQGSQETFKNILKSAKIEDGLRIDISEGFEVSDFFGKFRLTTLGKMCIFQLVIERLKHS